jgi:hypothetical protein
MFPSVDGGRSRIPSSVTSQGRRQRFLAFIVGAPGSLALKPHSGSAVDAFYVDGGCSRISISTR